MTDEVVELHGGVANAGAVVRIGNDVLRPAPPNSATVHRFLRYLADSGDAIASDPIGLEGDGRERLRFIPGDVAIPPYPSWSQSDEALASIALLMRSFHEASQGFPRRADDVWCTDGVDPVPGGSLICHNDVCLENVVFREGKAVALLDFDFAAPGRRVHDLASFARSCVPIDEEVNRARLGWEISKQPERLRLVADTYGATAAERIEMVVSFDRMFEKAGEFVRRRVEAGDPGFVAMWDAMGGMARFDRLRDWWAAHHDEFVAAMR